MANEMLVSVTREMLGVTPEWLAGAGVVAGLLLGFYGYLKTWLEEKRSRGKLDKLAFLNWNACIFLSVAQLNRTVNATAIPVSTITEEVARKPIGFEAIFAISGLLAVVYIVLRQKE